MPRFRSGTPRQVVLESSSDISSDTVFPFYFHDSGTPMSPGSLYVTEAELSVLEVLWRGGGLSIRQITEQVYPRGRSSDYATVQKLLERLEAKNCVRRDRSSFAHTFDAAIERDDLVGRELEDLAEKLCGGSLTPFLVHLVEKRGLPAEEREQLRRLLDAHDRPSGDAGRS